MNAPGDRERYQTVVVGAGQAGLSVGYHLQRRGWSFTILEANERVGDTWRRRWDSLRLFTPARFDGLDGMPVPGPDFAFPTKDEMADYLEAYAARFELPVRTGVRALRVSRKGGCFLVETSEGALEADNVVVAMATFQRPAVPAYAAGLDPAIVQLHSSEYLSPSQLRPGDVLVVGAGNSGAEIAAELAPRHRTWLAGRDVGEVPFRIDGALARLFLLRLVFRVAFHRVLTTSTPIGRKVRRKLLHIGGPLIRTKWAQLDAAGVERMPRVEGARDGLPLLADGRVLEVANVVWCTGFHPGFSWIDLPVFDPKGHPRHQRGVVGEQTGLYFVGMHFQHALSSTMIHGVGRDADHVVRRIVERCPGDRDGHATMAGRGGEAAVTAAR